jgi:hypothetical protein
MMFFDKYSKYRDARQGFRKVHMYGIRSVSDDEPEVSLVVGGRHPGHYFIDSDNFNDIVTRSV